NFEDEHVTFSGGMAVTGWTHVADGLYKAYAGTDPDMDFRQLYVNGERAVRARTPNAGNYLTFETEKAEDGFNLPLGLIDSIPQSQLQDKVEISILAKWMHKRLRITDAQAVTVDGQDYTRAVINAIEWDDLLHGVQAF